MKRFRLGSSLRGQALRLAMGQCQQRVLLRAVERGDGRGADLIELEESRVLGGQVHQEGADANERLDRIILDQEDGALAQRGGQLARRSLEEAGLGREVLVAGGRGHLTGTCHTAQRHLAPAVGLDEVQGGVDESLTGVRAAPVYLHTR